MSFQPYPPIETRGGNGPHGRGAPKQGRRPAQGHHAAKRRIDSLLTFGQGRYLVRVGPVAFWTAVGSLVVMAAWSIVTATYFAFHDDVLTRLIARQHDMRHAYEDRIADLRAQIDRVTSRQMLDQEQFERKFDILVRRQLTLESRAAAINTLADPVTTGSIKAPPARNVLPAPPPAAAPDQPRAAGSDRGAFLGPKNLRNPPAEGAKREQNTIADALAHFQQTLDRLEQRQAKALELVEETYDTKARRMRGVLTELGLNVAAHAPANRGAARGGPFVPLRLSSDSGAFERRVQRIQLARAQLDQLQRTLVTVPYRKPLAGEIETSSGYGVRIDPFLRAPAMHTGLDFRGNSGDPVRATAAGTVASAGWNGGYGKMVEIDHGNGFATRYAHLSTIDVEVGDAVKIGQLIGKIGSTGRSTGPHLHYETRVDGEPVDPQKFLRAGIQLGG